MTYTGYQLLFCGEPAVWVTYNKMAQLIDERFPDERMVKRYPYMRFQR